LNFAKAQNAKERCSQRHDGEFAHSVSIPPNKFQALWR
jgi:hypothetical protein